jgi:ribose-phosphate pyrophosphokinase
MAEGVEQRVVLGHSASQTAREKAQRFPPVLVMAHPSMVYLAENLVSRVHELEMKGETERYKSVKLWNNISWKTFRDKWPNIFIKDVEEIAGRDVIFVASFDSPSVIFEQLSLIYSLPRYLVRSFRLILPFFSTGTMERVDKEGQVVTAKTLATMLSQIPLASRGPAQIIIFDIHSLQERFYFSDQVIPRLLTAMSLLVKQLRNMEEEGKKVMVVFPDEGASKRFKSDLEDWGANAIICGKVRNGDKRVVAIKDGDPRGWDVVIVDDLIQTGGTIMECAKVLQERGAASISVFVTHPVFPEDSWKTFLPGESEVLFAKFWVTDSLPRAKDLEGKPPFHVLSLCDVIADLLSYDLLFKNA